MPILLRGVTSGVDVDVESATKALRTTQRPIDYGTGGSFQLTSKSGTMAEALAADAPIYAFRVASASLLAVVRRVAIKAWTITPASDIGNDLAMFELMRATAWTVADTDGVTDTITTNNGKLRTTMASIAALAEIRHSSTAALSAGTRTLDAQPISLVAGNAPNTAGTLLVDTLLLDKPPGEYPLVLAASEGFIVRVTLPTAFTWGWAITTEWDEVESY